MSENNGVIKCTPVHFGYMWFKRLSKEDFLEFLIDHSEHSEDERVPCKMDLVEFGRTNKNKRNYSSSELIDTDVFKCIYAAYTDEFKFKNVSKPDITTIEVIQSTDYERLNKISECFRYPHHLTDTLILNYMMEEKDNDDMVAKVTYRCSIPYNNCMHDTNSDKNIPALRRRFRHR